MEGTGKEKCGQSFSETDPNEMQLGYIKRPAFPSPKNSTERRGLNEMHQSWHPVPLSPNMTAWFALCRKLSVCVQFSSLMNFP